VKIHLSPIKKNLESICSVPIAIGTKANDPIIWFELWICNRKIYQSLRDFPNNLQ